MELDYIKLKEIKPVLSGYIRESQILMKSPGVPSEKAVHDVRVLMKKSRATLKLVGPQLEREAFDRDFIALREVGRLMREWRESSVYRKTLKELRKEHPEIFSILNEHEKITELLKKPDPLQPSSDEIVSNVEKISDILNRAGYRIRFESMTRIDPRLLIRELELTYASVIDIYITCRSNPKPRNLHEFRKKAKDFLYQIYFFRPLNPDVVKDLEKKLDGMTQNLGRFNDLDQLVRILGYKYSDRTNIPAMDELIILIRQKQDRILERVWPSAYKIFCPGQKLVNALGFRLLII